MEGKEGELEMSVGGKRVEMFKKRREVFGVGDAPPGDPNAQVSFLVLLKLQNKTKNKNNQHNKHLNTTNTTNTKTNKQRAAYGIPPTLSATNETNRQMVWGCGTYGILASDMETFFTTYNLNQNLSLLVPKVFSRSSYFLIFFIFYFYFFYLFLFFFFF